jgi:hypothetical protein
LRSGKHLKLTALVDNDLLGGFAAAAAKLLNIPNNVHASVIGDLTEDDVLAIEPAGHNGGDEELRAVAVDEKELEYESSRGTLVGIEIRTCWGRH